MAGHTSLAEAGELEANAVLSRVAAPVGSSLRMPRLLLVFAHPDDEVLAVGARLERMRDSHLRTLTDGAPRDGGDASRHGFLSLEDYRFARQQELRAALADAQLAPEFMTEAEGQVPDQEACLHLADLTRAVAKSLAAYVPEAVLTHPYEGGHPDHDACCFAVHTAVRLLSSQGAVEDLPILVEAPFYNAGEGGSMRTGVFLETGSATPAIVVQLSEDEVSRKRARLRYFASQAETLAQFALREERFRVAPVYDFEEPPHPGSLFYEQFEWGMSGARFRALAREALEELGLSTPSTALSAGAQD